MKTLIHERCLVLIVFQWWFLRTVTLNHVGRSLIHQIAWRSQWWSLFLDQLQNFWQLYLIELIVLLTGLGLLYLQQLIYPSLSKGFGMLLHKRKYYGISDQIFYLISYFPEYPVNAGVPQGSILGPMLFLPYMNDLLDDVISSIAIYADNTTLNSKCDLWQQLELASKLGLGTGDLDCWTGAGSDLLISVLKNLTGVIWLRWCHWFENGWVYSWGKIIF